MENINIIKTKLFCSIEMTPISPPSMYVPIALATYLASVQRAMHISLETIGEQKCTSCQTSCKNKSIHHVKFRHIIWSIGVKYMISLSSILYLMLQVGLPIAMVVRQEYSKHALNCYGCGPWGTWLLNSEYQIISNICICFDSEYFPMFQKYESGPFLGLVNWVHGLGLI